MEKKKSVTKKKVAVKAKAVTKRKAVAIKKRAKPKYDFEEKNPFYEILNQVIDPELGIGVADMGLIYDVKLNKQGVATVVMTLTSMGCPMGPDIAGDIDSIMRTMKGVKDVDIEVVWDPPWTPDRMKPEIKEMLFGC